jgi:hypothetical protein
MFHILYFGVGYVICVTAAVRNLVSLISVSLCLGSKYFLKSPVSKHPYKVECNRSYPFV